MYVTLCFIFSGSNACTLITVLLSGKINEFKIVIWGYQDQPLSRMLVTSLAEAIIDGNEIHEGLIQAGTVQNMDLTVPEALRATKFKYPNLVEWGDVRINKNYLFIISNEI